MHVNPLILYAPNVHIGGGFELLADLLGELGVDGCIFILDIRVKDKINYFPDSAIFYWVRPSVLSRMHAEILLSKLSKKAKLVLCFHGLPPLFRQSSQNVIVYFQNMLLLEQGRLVGFAFPVKLRINFERFILRFFRNRAGKYFVQTQSMKTLLSSRYKDLKDIEIRSFIKKLPEAVVRKKKWSYIYAADGLPHKNHKKLIEAWVLLSFEGIYPSLLLTIDKEKYRDLAEWIDEKKLCHHIDLTNVGWVDKPSLTALYESSQALIFPSTKESFGLPLMEAKHTGLKILAPELDYVRDVVNPDETFDPDSAVSIARAVKRDLALDTIPETITGTKEFIGQLLRYI